MADDSFVAPKPDKQGCWHYTYVAYNPDTGQWYGGKHSTRNLNDGYRGSGNWIVNHPFPERLVIEIVAFHDSEEMAYLAEAILVDDDMVLNDPLCMNMRSGGEGQTRQAASELAKRQWANSALRTKMSKAIRLALAKPEVKAKKSAKTRRLMADPALKEKIAATRKQTLVDPIARWRTLIAPISNINLRRQTDPLFKAAINVALKNAMKHPVVKANHIAANKRNGANPVIQEKLAASHKQLWSDPAFRAKGIERLHSADTDPVTRLNRSKAAIRRWSNMELRRIQSETVTKSLADPSVKDKRAEGNRRTWADPIIRAKRIAGIKRARAAKTTTHQEPGCGGPEVPGPL